MQNEVPLLVDERTDALQPTLGRQHVVQFTLAWAGGVEVTGHRGTIPPRFAARRDTGTNGRRRGSSTDRDGRTLRTLPSQSPTEYVASGPAVRDFTLYLDETGSFVSPRQPPGVRLVAGVLLEGSPSEHERELRPLLSHAFGWWRGEWHAVSLHHPWEIAVQARASRELGECVPDAHRADFTALGQLRRSEILGFLLARDRLKRWLTDVAGEVRRRVGGLLEALLATNHGVLFAAIEQDGTPAESRYVPMLLAAVERALWILEGTSEAVRLHVVAESITAHPVGSVLPLITLLEDHRRHRAGPEIDIDRDGVRFVEGASYPVGIVLADFLAYVLRWKSPPDRCLSDEQVKGVHLPLLQVRLQQYLGVTHIPIVVDPRMTLPALRAVRLGTLDRRVARRNFAPANFSPTTGTVRAAYDSALHTLDAWGAPVL